jgi:hypothetical protein
MRTRRLPGVGPPKKNWSVDDIKNTLQIDNETYEQLYSSLEDEMQQHHLMFSPLHEAKSQLLLQLVYKKTTERFPHVFEQHSTDLGKKSVTRLAQKCQFNFRRRRENLKSDSKHEISSPDVSAIANLSPLPSSPARTSKNSPTLIIHDRRQDLDQPINQYIYRLKDLVKCPTQTDESISKDDLRFEAIQDVLKTDLNFDPASEMIALYTNNIIYRIVNNRTLNGALDHLTDSPLSIDIISLEHAQP